MDAAMVAINTRKGRATGKDGMAVSRHGISMVFGLLTGFFLSGCAGEPDPRPIIVAEAKPALSPQTIDWAINRRRSPCMSGQARIELSRQAARIEDLRLSIIRDRKFDDLRRSDAGVRKLMRCGPTIEHIPGAKLFHTARHGQDHSDGSRKAPNTSGSWRVISTRLRNRLRTSCLIRSR